MPSNTVSPAQRQVIRAMSPTKGITFSAIKIEMQIWHPTQVVGALLSKGFITKVETDYGERYFLTSRGSNYRERLINGSIRLRK